MNTSCALVGSGGSLLFARHGAEIDAHDVVMRFNDAPTRGFEAMVGRRTTHRLISTGTHRDILERCRAGYGSLEGAAMRERIDYALLLKDSGDPCELSRAEAAPACCPKEQLILSSMWTSSAECFSAICPNSILHRDLSSPYALAFKQEVDDMHRRANRFRPRHMVSGMHGLVAAVHLCGSMDFYGFDLGGVWGALANAATPPPAEGHSYNDSYHYYDGCMRDAEKDLSPESYSEQLALLRTHLPRLRVHGPTSRTPLFAVPEPEVCRIFMGQMPRVCGIACPAYFGWVWAAAHVAAEHAWHVLGVTCTLVFIFLAAHWGHAVIRGMDQEEREEQLQKEKEPCM